MTVGWISLGVAAFSALGTLGYAAYREIRRHRFVKNRKMIAAWNAREGAS